MARIVVKAMFPAPPDRVWAELADLASHADWMAEAEEIRFETDQRSGVGTRMRVPTRVGPLHTNDLLVVTEWEEGKRIGVEHTGMVSGVGRFDIASVGEGTEMTWREELHFPWYFAGPVGAWLARPILARIWRRNLRQLSERVNAP